MDYMNEARVKELQSQNEILQYRVNELQSEIETLRRLLLLSTSIPHRVEYED